MITDDLGQLIEDAALAEKGTNMWSNTMGGAPDNAIGLYQSTAFDPELAMGRVVKEIYNLQVVVRAATATPTLAETTSLAIFNLLSLYNAVIGTYHYTVIPRHAPHSIGEDENKRQKWSCNYRVYREAV